MGSGNTLYAARFLILSEFLLVTQLTTQSTRFHSIPLDSTRFHSPNSSSFRYHSFPTSLHRSGFAQINALHCGKFTSEGHAADTFQPALHSPAQTCPPFPDAQTASASVTEGRSMNIPADPGGKCKRDALKRAIMRRVRIPASQSGYRWWSATHSLTHSLGM
ncbi:hypothetical protein BZA05DRAFT_394250 [Tricharina praecox]|uniref:uncharacterized protein n=1 Tax=Tricharina praecox TaxID=43433 RepID=UPI00221FC472|nr:uncharacterized protein BZA05DRAFT_394250 [Tricharina praecox]KAI5854443.1 hypothetical protein BZA05DRAFT_394250 [Tricharina praecox]